MSLDLMLHQMVFWFVSIIVLAKSTNVHLMLYHSNPHTLAEIQSLQLMHETSHSPLQILQLMRTSPSQQLMDQLDLHHSLEQMVLEHLTQHNLSWLITWTQIEPLQLASRSNQLLVVSLMLLIFPMLKSLMHSHLVRIMLSLPISQSLVQVEISQHQVISQSMVVTLQQHKQPATCLTQMLQH